MGKKAPLKGGFSRNHRRERKEDFAGQEVQVRNRMADGMQPVRVPLKDL